MTAKMLFKEISRYLQAILGAAVYSLGLYSFTVPNDIAAGGVSGILTMVNHLTGFPVGIGYLLANIPLILLGWWKVGKGFVGKTAAATVTVTVLLDYIYPLFVPKYINQDDTLLVAIFGGLVMGIGLGLIFSAGGSSGGTDIICRIVKKKFPFFPLGKITLSIDIAIIAASALVYGRFEFALYAGVAIYVASEAIDKILNGLAEGKLIFIVTKKYRDVSAAIINKADRGCTILKSEGAYEGAENGVVLCAIRNNETYKITDITKDIDKAAFMVVTEAADVLGEGFERRI